MIFFSERMMTTEHKKNSFLTFFCIAITSIAAMHYVSAIPSLFHVFYEVSSTCIELVIDHSLPGEFLSEKTFGSANSRKTVLPEQLEYLPVQRFLPDFMPLSGVEPLSGEPQVLSPIQRIIACLHKKHISHQSSDEDIFPYNASVA